MADPAIRSSGRGKGAIIVLLAAFVVTAVLGAALAPRLRLGADAIAHAASPHDLATGAQLDVFYAELDEAWSRHNWPKSIQALSAIVSLDPNNSQAMRTKLYQAHVNLGWQLLVDHSFTQAGEQFRHALAIVPDGDEATAGLELLQQFIIPAGSAALAPTAAPPIICTPALQAPISPAPPVCSPTPQAPACQAAQPASCANCVVHVVRTGDTLFSLARRFNTTVEAIMAANCLTTCTIRVCQILHIPMDTCPQTVCQPSCLSICPTAQCPSTCLHAFPICSAVACQVVCAPTIPCCSAMMHVVQRGEDLFLLAIRYRVSVSVLMKANGLTDTTVKAGQVLLIP